MKNTVIPLALFTLLLCACGDSASPANVAEGTGGTSANEDAGSTSNGATSNGVADAGGMSDTGSAMDDTGGGSDDTGGDDQDVDTTRPAERIVLPLGETLFLSGDEYLALWDADYVSDGVEVVEKPEGATAVLNGDGMRLTPDLPGRWVISSGGSVLAVDVQADYLNEDTFLNFNYTPVQPLALVGEDDVWVASPTSNAVHRVQLTADGAVAQELVPTGSWPTSAVLWSDGGVLLVAQMGRDSLGFLNVETKRLEDAILVGNEPASIVLDTRQADAPVAYIALSGEDAVVRVDLLTRQVTGKVDVGREPRAMAFDPAGDRLFVASLLSLNATPLGQLQVDPIPVEDQRDVAVINTESFTVDDWVHETGTILRGLWLDPENPERLIVARTDALNVQGGVDADSTPHKHGLAIVDIDKSSDALYTVTSEVDLDDQPSSSGPAASPFSMLSTADGRHLLVTLSAGKAVLVLDAETFEEVTRIESGHDPRGLVFAKGRFWTYAWLNNVLQGWDIPEENEAFGQGFVELEVGDDPTPTAIKEGQQIFNDAAFSKHGDFSCNNCHVDGLTDGLVWNILLDGDVNTLAFRNVAGSGPFLWGGFLPTLFDFSREVLRLVGAEATGEQMEKLTLYMQSVTAPPNPYTLPGGKHTEAGLRGKQLFFDAVADGGAACNACHSGPLYTNLAQVPGKTPDLNTDVPSLIGVYDTGPWGREGQWTTLEQMVDFAVEFTGATGLNADQRADLTQFVRELPGDLLYLNSASPLKDSEHAYFETPIVLTFSSVLRDSQEGLFSISTDGVEGSIEPVPGTWSVKGRNARFTPDEPLKLSTSYYVHVEPGLGSVLGQTLHEGIDYTFTTGEIPELDGTGRWLLTITADVLGESASVEVAFIQSTGGLVSGTILESYGEFDLDHINGYVSGTTFIIEPLLIQTPFGEVLVESGVLELEGGGIGNYATRGEGELRSIIVADVVAERLSYPDGVEE